MPAFGTLSPGEEGELPPDVLTKMLLEASRGAAKIAAVPGQVMQPNPYPPGSEEAYWYDDQRDKAATTWGPETALAMVRPGFPAGVAAKAGEAVLGSGAARMSKADITAPPVRPELATRYPETAPPVEAIDKKSGKTFLQKQNSPEALATQEMRMQAQREIDAGNYDPYFDPAQRFDVDPEPYRPMVDTRDIRKATAKSQEKYDAHARSPEASARLDEAFQRGMTQAADAGNWYHMGQLESEFIKEYGPIEGRKMFKERFADAMAATTGGASPTDNLMMAHYGNYLKAHGQPMPTAAYEFPYPIGGRYVSGNMKQYDKMINQGAGVTPANPKRYNFSNNFLGGKGATIDEQMSGLFDPKMAAPEGGTYGHYESALAERAAQSGVDPRYYQEVAWAGAKDAKTKGGYKASPMITHINEAIERTHRITGLPREEIVRRGLVRAEIPLYGAAGAVAAPVFGSMINRDE